MGRVEKTQLLPALKETLPTDYGRYFEPFIGGGALLLSVQPKAAVINDYNPELSNLYSVLGGSDAEFQSYVDELEKHAANHSRDYFVSLRNLDREDGTKPGTTKVDDLTPAQRAARFTYINKAAFKGIIQYGTKGQLTSGFAGDKLVLPSNDELLAVRDYFKTNKVEVRNGDYADAVADAKRAT